MKAPAFENWNSTLTLTFLFLLLLHFLKKISNLSLIFKSVFADSAKMAFGTVIVRTGR